jgi:glutamate-1-semialdehyde 2,1-aminomutase
MRFYKSNPVVKHLWDIGQKLRLAVEEVIRGHGLQDHIPIIGKPCCLVFGTLDQNRRGSQAFRSLFLQETIRRGVLMPALVVSYSHSDTDIEKTVAAIDGAARVYKKALDEGVERFLVGRPSKVVFRRYNHRD